MNLILSNLEIMQISILMESIKHLYIEAQININFHLVKQREILLK